MADNDEKMRKKKDGDTLGEKIEKALNKISKKKVTELIDDAFYSVELQGGIPFQVKRTDTYRSMTKLKLNYGRTYDIIDEELVRNREMQKEAEEEAKRDQTWEDFLKMYQDHIEGKIDPDTRTANRPETAMAPDEKA